MEYVKLKNVIVTGANGFIGKNLIKNLVENNVFVYAVDVNFDDDLLQNKNIKCIGHYKSIFYKLSKEINEKIDCIFHLAWAGTSGKNRSDYNMQLSNIKMTCDYIMFAKEIFCQRFIYASSINEIESYEYLQSDDISPSSGYIYGAAKLAGHMIGEVVAYQNGVDFIPVIISNIYGIGENSERLINSSIRKLLKKEHCSFTSGNQMYDFIYITDAIDSIIEVAKKGIPFNRYYIGSGKIKPLKEYLNQMKNIVDPNAELGFGEICFKGKEISFNQFDLLKVQNDTGYVNKVDFEKGIKNTMRYIQDEEK